MTYKGVDYTFMAFTSTELPSLVQLSFQLPRKGMLPEENTLQQVAKLMSIVAADNEWPVQDEGPQPITIVSCFWSEFKDSGRGHWLIRFRVSKQLATFIRDRQQGLIKVICSTYQVYHKREMWKGDVQPTLVHPDDPVHTEN